MPLLALHRLFFIDSMSICMVSVNRFTRSMFQINHDFLPTETIRQSGSFRIFYLKEKIIIKKESLLIDTRLLDDLCALLNYKKGVQTNALFSLSENSNVHAVSACRAYIVGTLSDPTNTLIRILPDQFADRKLWSISSDVQSLDFRPLI